MPPQSKAVFQSEQELTASDDTYRLLIHNTDTVTKVTSLVMVTG
jgi:hypothetical protein